MSALLLVSACEAVMVGYVNTARRDALLPELPVAMYLTETARSNSAEMCQVRSVAPSGDPLSDHDGESARAIHERVGRAVLDPAIEDGAERNVAATDAIWARWRSDPALTAAQRDEMGVGEATFGDGRLYMTLLLRDNPAMPASGRYATRVHRSPRPRGSCTTPPPTTREGRSTCSSTSTPRRTAQRSERGRWSCSSTVEGS